MPEIASILQASMFLGALSETEARELAVFARPRELEADQMLFIEGEPAREFFLVLSGRIQVFKQSPEGKEVVLHLFGAGESVAEHPIFSNRPRYPASAVALQPTRLLGIQGEAFREWARQRPDVLLAILGRMSRRMQEFSRLIADFTLYTVEGRLTCYLLSLPADEEDLVRLSVSKKTLAAMLGTIPETLSRGLRRLAEQGLIAIEGDGIRICKRAELALLAAKHGG